MDPTTCDVSPHILLSYFTYSSLDLSSRSTAVPTLFATGSLCQTSDSPLLTTGLIGCLRDSPRNKQPEATSKSFSPFIFFKDQRVLNEKLKLAGDGEPDTVTGDLVFVLKVKKHPLFKREGDNLHVEHTLSLTEALCGFQFALTRLDGRLLLIKSNPGEVIKPDQSKSINDEGMPNYKMPIVKGRLFIFFNIDFPESGFLSPEKSQIFETILPSSPTNRLSDMALEDCEETILHDVDMEEEMRRKERKWQEAYDEDDKDDDDMPDVHRMACNQQ